MESSYFIYAENEIKRTCFMSSNLPWGIRIKAIFGAQFDLNAGSIINNLVTWTIARQDTCITMGMGSPVRLIGPNLLNIYAHNGGHFLLSFVYTIVGNNWVRSILWLIQLPGTAILIDFIIQKSDWKNIEYNVACHCQQYICYHTKEQILRDLQ